MEFVSFIYKNTSKAYMEVKRYSNKVSYPASECNPKYKVFSVDSEICLLFYPVCVPNCTHTRMYILPLLLIKLWWMSGNQRPSLV